MNNFTKFFNEINKINKNQLKNMTGFVLNGKSSSQRQNLQFEWEDKSLFDYVNLKFDELKLYTKSYEKPDDQTHELIAPINNIIKKFNDRKIDYFTFLKLYTNLEVNLQQALKSEKYSIRYENFQNHFLEASFSSLKGVGGLGKSHFLWECQKLIQSEKLYKSLFIYGKFFKDIESIPWNKIIEYSKEKEFLLVIDGINEIPDINKRIYIYDKIKELKKCKYSRVFISYRTYSLTNKIDKIEEEHYIDELMGNTIYFQGVDFDSSITQIVKNYKIDFSYYYHVLNTNNPMRINMLIEGNIFNDKELIEKFKTLPIISITTIYERYILSACRKLWKADKNKYWNEIKSICKNMYKFNRSYFVKEDFSSKKLDFYKFVHDLENGGYVVNYDGMYYFSWEQLSNYLIARTFHDDIKGKSIDETVSAFERKSQEFPNIKQFLLSVVVEKYHANYKNLIQFFDKTTPTITEETLSNIVINDISIRKELQNHIKVTNNFNLFAKLGGLPDRLFNCESYYFDLITKRNIKIIKPKIFSDKSEIIRKLKCILHNINGEFFVIENAIEFFKFASICLLIPDETILELSEKIMLDIIENNEIDFFDDLSIMVARKNSALFKRAIYNVICHLSKEKLVKYKSLLNKIRNNKSFINAKILTNYSKLITKKPFNYVDFSKINLFEKYKNKLDNIKDGFNEFKSFGGLIAHIRLHKLYYSLNMDNYNSLKLNFRLPNIDKRQMLKFNALTNNLIKIYNKCNCPIEIWDSYFDKEMDYIKNKIFDHYSIVNQEGLFWGFVYHLQKTLKYYGISNEEITWYKEHSYSRFSIYPDNVSCIVSICVEEYVGSLMCNYFNDECKISYWEDNKIYLGFEPISYDEEQVALCSPLSSYNEIVRVLDNLVINRINDSYKIKRNKRWADNKSLSFKNCREILKPYKLNDQSWILLSAYISPHYYYKVKNQKRDYSEECIIVHCATNYNKNKKQPLNRYKTIEIGNYKNSIYDYNKTNSDFCKNIDTLKNNNDIFGETNLVLPPSFLIKKLHLHYNHKDCSWVDESNSIVIICNNDIYHRYEDYIGHSIYINKKYLDENKNKLQLYYYIFTEKISYDTGVYSNKSDMHIIIKNGKVLKYNMNSGSRSKENIKFFTKCHKCILYKKFIYDR